MPGLKHRRSRTSQPAARPASATVFLANLLALAVGIGVIVLLARVRPAFWAGLFPYAPLVPCLCLALVLVLVEALTRWRRGQRLPAFAATPLRPRSWRRVAWRMGGFAATLGLVALAYALFPEYAGSFYAPYWAFLRSIAPVLCLVPFYFAWADRRAHDPDDEYVQFGRLLTGRRNAMPRQALQRHLLGWVVKGYFLPLMTVYLNDDLRNVVQMVQSFGAAGLARYDFWFQFSYTVDLLFCVVGYTASTRLLDSHLRSVEPTMLGWVVTLVCYQPLYSVVGRFYLQYEGSVFWDNWLAPWPLLRDVWGGAIIVLTVIYALCTVAFGLRFSNLTHRGIITGGPYRFSKHPAYLSKNLSWWLISVPFALGEGWATGLRHCGALLLLNGLYVLRARTEERHLGRDPVYREYAEWMNRHGPLRALVRRFPGLGYRPPPDAMPGTADRANAGAG